jgi:hypothetical protein
MKAPANPLSVGVNLAGYLDSIIGIGEAARQVRGALEAAGVPVAPFTLVAESAERLEGAAPPWPSPPPFPVNLVCVNPDGLEGAHDALGTEFFEGRRTVGLWWWEVDALPDRWGPWFDLVDELWACSHHVADALSAVAPVPVVRMPMPLAEPRSSGAGRAELGLPDGFMFLFAFDYGGVMERKNPLAVVRAFARAFASGEDAVLVLKTIGAEAHPAEHRRLLAEAGEHQDVHVLDRSLAADDMAALIGACDCYLSLHRSEGFGLTIAEAMLAGKPVIATAYGGPRDLLTASNSFPVDYELVPIGPRNDPYPGGGRWAEPDEEQAAELMRAVAADPEAARRRGERARRDLVRDHSPEAAGRAMARRLAAVAGLPAGADGAPTGLDIAELLRRIRSRPAERPDARLRAPLRRAVLRLIRPQAAHQRHVDEEIARLLRSMDERVRGLAESQASLSAELGELRRRLEELER